MTNFDELRTICKKTSDITGKVVDEFLLFYSARREGLDKEMDQRLLRFRQVTREYGKSWLALLKSQYIVHRIFRKNGFIKKYLKHAAIKDLTTEELSFLEHQSAIPWRYSFSTIKDNPSRDFYEMEDAFTGESFLMHSPSISVTLSNRPVSIWFNLVGFNGACWQSYGAVTGYSAFGPDDIFFFATELNPAIESEEELMADVENNPIPYLMLTSGSKYPLSVHGDDEILQVFAEHSLASFDKGRLNRDFKIEYNQGIYRISLEPWSDPPHYAQAYYAESKRQLLISSLTDRGFHELVAALNKHGFGLEEEPDIRVQLSMLVSIHHILGKKIQLNPYEELFKVKPGPEAQDEMDKVNRLLELAIPVIDAGMEPNFWELAKEAGVEEEMAREVIHTTMDRINKLKS